MGTDIRVCFPERAMCSSTERGAPITGRVCMDQFMVDVTDIMPVAMGDEVTLIGTDGAEKITMEQLGDLSGRFNYELACDISKRVPRAFVKNGEIVATKRLFYRL